MAIMLITVIRVLSEHIVIFHKINDLGGEWRQKPERVWMVFFKNFVPESHKRVGFRIPRVAQILTKIGLWKAPNV